MRGILSKKGAFELDQLQSVVITLVVIGIVAGLGLIVLGSFQEYACGDDWNATTGVCDDPNEASTGINDTLSAVAGIPSWLPLIILVVIIGIILAIVFRVLPGARGGATPMGY